MTYYPLSTGLLGLKRMNDLLRDKIMLLTHTDTLHGYWLFCFRFCRTSIHHPLVGRLPIQMMASSNSNNLTLTSACVPASKICHGRKVRVHHLNNPLQMAEILADEQGSASFSMQGRSVPVCLGLGKLTWCKYCVSLKIRADISLDKWINHGN